MKKYASIALLLVAVGAVSSGSGATIRSTFLTGVGNVKGKVVWKFKDKGTEHQAELSASGENLRPNTTYTFVVGANPPATVTTDGFGTFRASARFTTLDRPTINVGDPATVMNPAGVVVLSVTMR